MTVARFAVAVLLAAACFFGGRTLLGAQAAAAEGERLALPPLPAEGRRDLALLDVEGAVERGTGDAGFERAERGAVLGVGESLRVPGGARAVLRLGVASRLSLEAGSEVTAVAVTPTEITLRLDSGRGRVELAQPARTVKLTSTDGGEVRAGGSATTRFLVAAHPGRLAVVNDDGAAPVHMAASGEELEVPPSRVSWSVRGAAPRPPIEPPRDPELELTSVTLTEPSGERPPAEPPPAESPPEGDVDSGALLTVRGRTHPLALVRLGDELIEVAADGSFEAAVPKERAPLPLLAALPTGAEALLEVSLPAAEASEAEAADGEPPATQAPPPVAEEPAKQVEKKVEAPKRKPKPKRKPQRRQPPKKQKPKPKPAAKKPSAVTWGATP